MYKDVNDVVNDGGQLLDLIQGAVDAHVRRASDQIKALARTLQDTPPDKRALAVDALIAKTSCVAAIGNGVKRDADTIKAQLIDLARIPGAKDGVQRLVLAVDHYLKSGIKIADGPSVLIHEILSPIADEAYPIPKGLAMVETYVLTPVSVSKIVNTKDGPYTTEVAQAAVIPTGLMIDIDTGKEMVVISWHLGAWKHIIVPREEATTKNKIEQFSAYGLPVNSTNAGDLSKYISDLVIANYRTMPRATVSGKMGWHLDDTAFLWGRTLITETKLIEYKFDVESTSPAQWDMGGIYFRPGDAGGAQLANALTADGTFEDWQKAIRFLDDKPEARAGLVLALVPVLLPIIKGSAPFTVDWGGSTSRGKSTTLLYASSVWGMGQEDGNRYFNTWETTRTNLERTVGILRHIPLLVDDTKKARKQSDVTSVIYDITSGVGRGRASLSGLAVSGEYRTIMMTTGESRVTSFSHDGGAFTRVLQFFGSPLGGTLTPGQVQALNASLAGIARNHGHLGPRFVQRMLANKNQWEALQIQYDKLFQKWSTAGVDLSPYAGRLAKYMAIFELASQLCSGFFSGVGKFSQEELGRFWAGWCKYANDADQPRQAFAYILNRCLLEKQCMWKDGYNDQKFAPIGGFRGYLPMDIQQNGIYLAKNWIEKWLREAAYDRGNAIEVWAQSGWLAKNPKNDSLLFPVTIDGSTVLLCHLTGNAIRAILAS